MSGRILVVVVAAVAAGALASAGVAANGPKPPKGAEPVVYVTEAV